MNHDPFRNTTVATKTAATVKKVTKAVTTPRQSVKPLSVSLRIGNQDDQQKLMELGQHLQRETACMSISHATLVKALIRAAEPTTELVEAYKAVVDEDKRRHRV